MKGLFNLTSRFLDVQVILLLLWMTSHTMVHTIKFNLRQLDTSMSYIMLLPGLLTEYYLNLSTRAIINCSGMHWTSDGFLVFLISQIRHFTRSTILNLFHAFFNFVDFNLLDTAIVAFKLPLNLSWIYCHGTERHWKARCS